MFWLKVIACVFVPFALLAIFAVIYHRYRSRDDYFEEMTELEKFNSSGRHWYRCDGEFEYVMRFSQKVEDGKIVFVVPKKHKYLKHYRVRDGGDSCDCSGYLFHKVRCYHMRMVENARQAGVFDFKIKIQYGYSNQICYVPLRSDNATELTRVNVIKKPENKEIRYVCEMCPKTKDLVCSHVEAVIAAAKSGEIVIR